MQSKKSTKMKQIFIAVIVLVVVSSCGNSQAEKETKVESTNEVIKVEDDAGKEFPTTDTTVSKPLELQASVEETEEDKERKLNIKRARTAIRNGVEYFKNGEMDKAKDAFKLVLEYTPEDSRACHYLGKIYYGFGQKEIALSYYEDAVQFNPEDSASMVGAGLILFEQKDYNGAIEYYNMAIKIAPRYALAFYNRGTLLGYQKNYGAALTDMNRAIEIEPENPKYYMNRGLANYYLERHQRACDDWEKAALLGNAEAQKALDLYCQKIVK